MSPGEMREAEWDALERKRRVEPAVIDWMDIAEKAEVDLRRLQCVQYVGLLERYLAKVEVK